MSDLRSTLERNARRVGPAGFTLEDVTRRFTRRQRNRRIATGAVALTLAAIVLGGWLLAITWNRSMPVDETPTPHPTGATRFQSPMHGYDIDVPSDSSVLPATFPWTWGATPRSDVINVGGAVAHTFDFDISIASVAVPKGMTEDEWQRQEEEQFRDMKAGTCRQDPTSGSIELDGVPSRILTACDGDLFIALVVQARGYVIATSGGAVVHHTPLFRSVIETIEFHPERTPPVQESAAGWRGIWPQTTQEEAKAAQQRADAAGSESVWQVDWNQVGAVAKRFVLEMLGWDGMRSTGVSYLPGNAEQAWEAEVVEWHFLRCADATNPLYPDDPRMGHCAPTIDQAHFEQVVVRAEQLIRRDRSGIWLVTGWQEVDPYEQAIPPSDAERADALALVREFAQARVLGADAEAYLGSEGRVYHLYEMSDGRPYGTYEVAAPGEWKATWPSGGYGTVIVRLFPEHGGGCVIQRISVDDQGSATGELFLSQVLPVFGDFKGSYAEGSPECTAALNTVEPSA
jgi:hypothetical protein